MPMSQQNKNLLRKGNTELSGLGIFVWSIPALVAKSEKFGLIKTCPNAGACAALCYARTGRYRFNNVINAHTRNLELYLDSPYSWKKELLQELKKKKFCGTGIPHKFGWKPREDFQWWIQSGGKAIRIHDSGDFFSYEYLLDWTRRCTSKPSNLILRLYKTSFLDKKSEDRGINSS